MQRKKRTKKQRAARNARWQKRWQRTKYLPRKAPQVKEGDGLNYTKIAGCIPIPSELEKVKHD